MCLLDIKLLSNALEMVLVPIFIYSPIISFVICIVFTIYAAISLLLEYRRNIYRLRQGKYFFKKQKISSFNATYLSGYIIGNSIVAMVVGFFAVLTMVLAFGFFIGFIIIFPNEAFDTFVNFIIPWFTSATFFLLVIRYVFLWIMRYVFMASKHFYRFLFLFSFLDIFILFHSAITGIYSAMFFGLVLPFLYRIATFLRPDRTFYSFGIHWDPTFTTYLSALLAADHYHNNPILITFAEDYLVFKGGLGKSNATDDSAILESLSMLVVSTQVHNKRKKMSVLPWNKEKKPGGVTSSLSDPLLENITVESSSNVDSNQKKIELEQQSISSLPSSDKVLNSGKSYYKLVSLIKAYWVILRIHFQEIHSEKSKAVFPHRVVSSSVKNMEIISPVGTEKTKLLEQGDHLRSSYLNICQVLEVKEAFSILDEDEIGLVTASNLKIAFVSMGYESSMMTDEFFERIVDENESVFEHHLTLNKKKSKKLVNKSIQFEGN